MGTNLLEVEYIVSGRVLLMRCLLKSLCFHSYFKNHCHLVIDWGLITQTLAIFQLYHGIKIYFQCQLVLCKNDL
jgi:hypothetical protein